ncbi:MAG: sulfatase-like hydrolase/transferase, partial [Planctomycetaceae bacterium]
MKPGIIIWAALLFTLCGEFNDRSVAAGTPAARPNIVYILCDDLGYGDVRCLNPSGKIATPQLDRLASQGMIFTDVHSGSAVCSPTRYGIMTGRYSWRSKLQFGVLGGLSPRLIEPGRVTVPSFLRQQGYATACIGKWHLGMDWVKLPGKEVTELNIETRDQFRNVDFSQKTTNGPNTVGFDYYFGISGSLDMIPYTFIENDHVVANPTVEKSFPLMLGRPNGDTRPGPAAPDFEASDVLPTFTKKAIEQIDRHAVAAKQGRPFFLYIPLASPHTPIVPNKEWQGKSGLNPYADFVMETDARIGEIVRALDERGIGDNTLVIVTSDNGCSNQAKFEELLAKGHNPSYTFRGHKADIFDGGHRVPFIARWPARVKAGSVSDELHCLTDLLATSAEITGAQLPDNCAEDSVSFLAALDGSSGKSPREAIVHHSANGSFAIRKGDWKLAFCPGSGGWSKPRPGRDDASQLPPVQLYNLKDDVTETTNRHDRHPELVQELTALMEMYVANGRSTPGAPQKNTVAVDFRKAGREAQKPLKQAQSSRPAGRKPNVLFLITDDQRADTVRALGNRFIQTPNTDKLVESGLVFRNAYCMGSTVPAVCTPSRTMLLSGKSLFHLKSPWNSRYEINFPKTMREAGYETYHHGKYGNGPSGIYKDFEHEKFIKNDNDERLSGYPGKEIADAAVEFFNKRDSSRPFFAYLAFGNPHDPRVINKEYRRPYEASRMPLPANFQPLHPFDNGWLAGRDEQLAQWPRTETEILEHLTDYYGVITYLDMQIGRVLDTLKQRGEYDNTIIVFTSDHGLAIGSHGLMGKQSLYDDAMKPPFIFSGPGIRHGSTDALVYLHDIFPTICDLSGVSTPPGLDARSFADVLAGRTEAGRESLFLAYLDVQRAVRRGDWKLIRYPRVNITQLFNLRDDPQEMRNLAESQPAKVDE